MKIIIKQSKAADTRSADKPITNEPANSIKVLSIGESLARIEEVLGEK